LHEDDMQYGDATQQMLMKICNRTSQILGDCWSWRRYAL